MNARVFKIWSILCVLHAAAAFILPLIRESWIIGIAVIYLTVLILGKTGLPGLLHPAEGWGWPSPTVLGWTGGILAWAILYYVLAYLLDRCQRS